MVEVEGRSLELSNLTKVLYPASGFTKADVIDYYRRIAPVLLPHLAKRPLRSTAIPIRSTTNSSMRRSAPKRTAPRGRRPTTCNEQGQRPRYGLSGRRRSAGR